MTRTDRRRVILIAAALVTFLGGCANPPRAAGAQSDPTTSTGPSAPTSTTSTAPSPAPHSSTARPASTTAPAHFTTVAPGSKLPSSAQCAAWVRQTTYRENKAVNRTANNTTGQHLSSSFFSGDDSRANSVVAARVDGQFTGTTHQILRWAACKWGIDEDLVYAQAAIESWWRQTTLGDWGTDASRCPPGHGLGVDGKTGQCPESWGILQNRYPYEQSSWPAIANSTAMNADLAYGIWRTCFEGYETWLNTVTPKPNPPYRAGDAWGCIGRWFSGRWHNSDAEGYITRVKDYLNRRIWETPNFQEP